MTKKETVTSLANVSAGLRQEEIKQAMDKARSEMQQILTATHHTIENLLQVITPVAQAITTFAEEAKSTLTDVNQQALSTLNAVQTTSLNLPTSYKKVVQESVTNLEKSVTGLARLSETLQKQAMRVADYAETIETRQRRSLLWPTITVAALASLVPTLAVFALAEAARPGGPASLWGGLRQALGL